MSCIVYGTPAPDTTVYAVQAVLRAVGLTAHARDHFFIEPTYGMAKPLTSSFRTFSPVRAPRE